MRRRDIKQLLLGAEETGGQRWANASSVTPGAMQRSCSRRRDNEADAQTDWLRRNEEKNERGR